MIIEYSFWGYALLTFMAFSALFGGIAAISTVFIGPGAVGSGTVEIINLFLPITFTLIISFAVGQLYSSSFYTMVIDQKSLPLLIETVPK